jgi:heme exporter protein A
MSRFAGRRLVCVRGERMVFAGLDFAVPAGGILLLRGPNGSGKSSLLRCMAGLLAPADGHLLWDDVPVAADPDAHRQRLRYLGHQDAVKPVLSVAENLLVWAQLYGAPDRASVAAALVRLGIAHIADVPARLLSAGQRRRVALARLLLTPAPLWLLDEPTTALDEDGVRRFAAVVADHCAGGGLAVLSSHGDPGLAGAALSLADYPPRAAEVAP